ncbi:MAG: hypothetical protein ABIJ09_23590 [Pseudomonadota bacterium]
MADAGSSDRLAADTMSGDDHVAADVGLADSALPDVLVADRLLADGASPEAGAADSNGADGAIAEDAAGADAMAEDARSEDAAAEDAGSVDTDGDTIPDAVEGSADPDGDLIPNRLDDDSDGDGLGDAFEAGDTDLGTAPRDSDHDGVPDFLDRDSDNDGLPDAVEHATLLTDPYDSDSDDDGASDLVEYGVGTDPLDPDDNPVASGALAFVVPELAASLPASSTLFHVTPTTDVDAYFLIDTTTSMAGELAQLKDNLTSNILPNIDAAFPGANVWSGVGAFEDYPYPPYGSNGDKPFRPSHPLTSSTAAVQTAVDALVIRGGNDLPEAHVPALHAVATGCGDGGGYYGVADDPDGACSDAQLIGYPHFRSGALPVIVLITDAVFHNGPSDYAYGAIPGVTPPTYAETVTALNSIHARVIGINSGGASTHTDLAALANATDTVDGSGPLVYDIPDNGAGLATQVLAGFQALVPPGMDITAQAVDDTSDGLDAVATFIDRVEADASASPSCAGEFTIIDYTSDGTNDTYRDVGQGKQVCFSVVARDNSSVAAQDTAQVFHAMLQIWGDHVVLLEQRDLYFVVPAR